MEIHQKKLGPDYHRLKTMVKRSIEQEIRNKNFEARNGNYEKNAVVKNQRTKQRGQRALGECWQWKANGQFSKGDNCSFRHDVNKRAKLTQPNPSPSSFVRQNERNASRTRSPRGKSPSGRMSRWPCKITSKELARTARMKNSLANGPKRMVTKVQRPCWRCMSSIIERRDPLKTLTHQIHDNWVAYSKIWSRQSLHRFYGRAQTYGNRSDV